MPSNADIALLAIAVFTLNQPTLRIIKANPTTNLAWIAPKLVLAITEEGQPILVHKYRCNAFPIH